jgi:signal recognition particle receptor subunit beta
MNTRRHKRQGSKAVKVVVTGPFAAGKTTFIRTISEITVLSTERGITDESRSVKTGTTVAMDFGRITIDSELVLYLFGTPGQTRFEFMWEILSDGMLGFILIVDTQDPTSFQDAAHILSSFTDIARVPFVVAANRCEVLDPVTEHAIRQTLGLSLSTPIVACDVTDRESVKSVLLSLLFGVLDQIEAYTTSGAGRI